MRKKHMVGGVLVTSFLLAGAGSAVAGAPASAVTKGVGSSVRSAAEFCGNVAGIYGVSGELDYKGKHAELWTERIRDNKARAYAKDIVKGDRVEVHRSDKKFKMSSRPQHPATVGGYDDCGDTANAYEANVLDQLATRAVRLQTGDGYSYAVRTCLFPKSGGKSCTKWYVDHK
ncbi:hypothetical protein H9W91_01170 [Streptomyces alfalfae]|uniref:hypothetical protein n=1 Tax=Streptomyces alfalfae TaxID=1642299 RepID=UPI001BA7B738|nr:hypothetical protein [Streptomyces alfalfae]QUI29633.1 hypothetical protein H9W91_01170 [Streptomyces alfalfae]